jgi:hypothetical protein|tara:strand:+ start:3255 stop:4118 length:864 start_codon:yes stop_codon:yes gene_type:complete
MASLPPDYTSIDNNDEDFTTQQSTIKIRQAVALTNAEANANIELLRIKVNEVGTSNNDLKDILGDTLSAAQSAAAAAASAAEALASENAAKSAKDDAVSAKNTAVSAKDDAVSAKNSAVSHAQLAGTHKNAAESAKGSAISHAQQAGASATTAGTHASNASTSASNASSSASTASGHASTASGHASTATTQAGIATDRANEIKNLTAATGAPGTNASYNSGTGVLTIPRGDVGATGLAPAHNWSGTSLRFKNPNGTNGSYVDLKGDKGDVGATFSYNAGNKTLTITS